MMNFYLILLYNAAEVLTIDKRTTVCDVKKMLEPLMKLSSNQFKVGIPDMCISKVLQGGQLVTHATYYCSLLECCLIFSPPLLWLLVYLACIGLQYNLLIRILVYLDNHGQI